MRIIICFILVIVILYLFIFKKNEHFSGIKKIKGINSFDNYFYINLEHRTDRKKQILNELHKMNIQDNKIIRIDAIRNKYNGHIGCCKSHIKTIEMAKKMNLNNIVVFEDDFVFNKTKKEVDQKINHFLKTYPKYDIVQLTTVYKSLKDINDKHVKKVEKASTSSAYIINKRFYNKLLDDLNESKNKMEKEMIKFNKKNNGKLNKKHETGNALDQHWNKLQQKSNWYIFDPYLGKQGGKAVGSSIMGGIEAFINNISFYKLHL
jgi:glycosyl transferase, family 25|tara:strand:+ start:155 stop:943 length:789 start_codon:yes stop_codon:yes gene_type:complete